MTLANLANPISLHDDLLDRTRIAYTTHDFSQFEPCFVRPHVIETFEGTRTITTQDEHRRIFDAMRATLGDMGVIDMKRRTIEAQWIDGASFNATFITEYILVGYKVSDEVVGNSDVVQSDGAWRVSHSRYATRMGMVSRALLRS